MDIQTLLAGVPTPSEAEMAGRRQFGRRYTLVHLRQGPAPRDDEARNESGGGSEGAGGLPDRGSDSMDGGAERREFLMAAAANYPGRTRPAQLPAPGTTEGVASG